MVKIAIAGGTGNLGREVIDGLVAAGKHEILLLSRKDISSDGSLPGVKWIKADYQDPNQLKGVLQGVDTVLSFIVAHLDAGGVAQKNLIDACVAAGVRRFAPSEWFSSSFENFPWYETKGIVREYLETLNKQKKVLEYSLFQPGLFLDELVYPYRSAKYVIPLEYTISFEKRRALILEGSEDARISLTTVQNIVQVVTKAVDYEGVWPTVGGIRGNSIKIGQLIALGEKIRGPFKVEKLRAEDLKAGIVKSDWKLKIEHPAIGPENADAWGEMVSRCMLLALDAGEVDCSDEWNQLLPDYKFTQAEEFLAKWWDGKP
ncbi:NmrA domain-containing protein [Fusarium sp. LHS14.1]|nr:NmrA domain-containing protein [Fusarium sp. LHS14.1]